MEPKSNFQFIFCPNGIPNMNFLLIQLINLIFFLIQINLDRTYIIRSSLTSKDFCSVCLFRIKRDPPGGWEIVPKRSWALQFILILVLSFSLHEESIFSWENWIMCARKLSFLFTSSFRSGEKGTAVFLADTCASLAVFSCATPMRALRVLQTISPQRCILWIPDFCGLSELSGVLDPAGSMSMTLRTFWNRANRTKRQTKKNKTKQKKWNSWCNSFFNQDSTRIRKQRILAWPESSD